MNAIEIALRRILVQPYGCRFCDSGKLRTPNNPEHIKNDGDWFGAGADCSLQRKASSKGSSRKRASAMIAKIPLVLSRHIAASWYPSVEAAQGL
jgi:hypothetical protein